MAPVEERFFKRVVFNRISGCHEWTGCRGSRKGGSIKGYGQIRINGKNVRVHRLAMELAGYDIEGWHVLHKCNNKICVNPEHLYLGTHQDNMRDMDRDGLRVSVKGAEHARAKLSEMDVHQIRMLNGIKVPQTTIAFLYGVNPPAINKITTGRTWSHV